MQHEWLMAGFGGQGILFLGNILAQAGMRQGLQTTYMPTYGVAMRGGTANCVVRLSDGEIGSPLLEAPDAAIILNQQSFDKFRSLIQPNGLIIANSSMVAPSGNGLEDTTQVIYIPATNIALEAVGTERSTNMVALGAFLASNTTIQADTIEKIFAEERNPAKQKLVKMNKIALQAGMAYLQSKTGA